MRKFFSSVFALAVVLFGVSVVNAQTVTWDTGYPNFDNSGAIGRIKVSFAISAPTGYDATPTFITCFVMPTSTTPWSTQIPLLPPMGGCGEAEAEAFPAGSYTGGVDAPVGSYELWVRMVFKVTGSASWLIWDSNVSTGSITNTTYPAMGGSVTFTGFDTTTATQWKCQGSFTCSTTGSYKTIGAFSHPTVYMIWKQATGGQTLMTTGNSAFASSGGILSKDGLADSATTGVWARDNLNPPNQIYMNATPVTTSTAYIAYVWIPEVSTTLGPVNLTGRQTFTGP